MNMELLSECRTFAFAFCVVTVKDEHRKPRFKGKRRG